MLGEECACFCDKRVENGFLCNESLFLTEKSPLPDGIKEMLQPEHRQTEAEHLKPAGHMPLSNEPPRSPAQSY
jgi:hypothetical protein